MSHGKIRLGISSCLLGYPVRYDGECKRNDGLVDAFTDTVEWIPVCPEVEAGFPVPREAIQLVAPVHAPHTVTITTRLDHTDQIMSHIIKIIDELERKQLRGFIFKSKSPSCGLRAIPVHNDAGDPIEKSRGIFAKAFINRFPLMPIADDIQLADALERTRFIDKIVQYAKHTSDLR